MSVNTQISVLIIDDYQTMRGVIRNLFNQLGFSDVREAGTTVEAMDLLKKEMFGLVVFDWHTGPESGENFMAAVKSDEKLKDVPFILISAESGDDQILSMKKSGAADFIAKPFTKATLQKKMAKLFGGS